MRLHRIVLGMNSKTRVMYASEERTIFKSWQRNIPYITNYHITPFVHQRTPPHNSGNAQQTSSPERISRGSFHEQHPMTHIRTTPPSSGQHERQHYFPLLPASKCHCMTFWKIPFPPFSITSP